MRRYLVGRVPFAVVSHGGQRQEIIRITAVIPQDRVDSVVVVGVIERAIVMIHIAGGQQGSPSERRAAHQQSASITISAMQNGTLRFIGSCLT